MGTTETSGHASSAGIKPVTILSVASAPPMEPTLVDVHYFEGEVYRHNVVKNYRPTYFDDIVVSQVSETLPAFRYPSGSWSSPKQIARSLRLGARQTRARLAGAVRYKDPLLDLRSMLPGNIAHLMCDIIPYSLLAKEVAGPQLKVLLQPVAGRFRDLLQEFGVTPVWDDRRVTGDIIKISGTRGLAIYDLPTTFDCNGVHFAPDVLLRPDCAAGAISEAGHERIFLARRAPRNLQNQAEIESIVGQRGYSTIYMEDFEVAEQLRIAARAKAVIAVHGAAMALLLVNSGLDSVVELLPANVYHQMFATCLGRRVRQYHQILPEFDVRVPHSGWNAISYYKNRNFAVDARLLNRLLDEVHGPSIKAS